MKKKLLTVGCLALLAAGAMAQTLKVAQKPVVTPVKPEQTEKSLRELSPNFKRCGTPTPSPEWDKWFNEEVEKRKQDMLAGKASANTYTIAVVVHIIHGGQAVGTYPNLSQAQINSQITVLNQDYGGTGYNTNTYPSTAFTGYASATSNSVSAASKDGNGRIAIANTGVTFCMATKDPNGNTLTEPGIDRINYTSKGWSNPTSFTSQTTFQNFIDGTVKPGSVWDPHKYLNMWVTDEAAAVGLLGYATFPAGTSLTGIPGGTGSATTDGFWAYAKAFGSKNIYAAGTYDPTYCYGRTCTHEIGHWVGLRHTWGDAGQCGATDYCIDTPPQQGQNNQPPGADYGCPTYPSNAATCTLGGQTNTNGDMFMNFMDYTDDACMYMFTYDQVARIQTAMSTGTYRSTLTTNAATLCNISVVTPVAGFTYPNSICATQNTLFTDASTGPPTAWSWSVTPSAGVVITTASSQNPTINFPAAGTYTVSLNASNSAGNNTTSHVVTVTTCTTSACDTLSNLNSTDTLTYYTVSNGYLSGSSTLTTTTTTTYQQKAIGELYHASSFPVNVTTVKGAMILFFKDGNLGTKGTSSITLSMVNNNAGVPGTTVMGTQTLSLSNVVGTTPVQTVPYAGSQAVSIGPFMLPYAVMFPSPISFSSDFFLTLTTPTNSDTIVVYSGMGNHNTSNTAAIQLKPSTSSTSTWYAVNNVFGLNFSFAIIPIACPAVGIESNELGSSIVIFPNPSEGNFNFAVSTPGVRTLNFNVVNTLGQTVFEKTERNLNNAVLTYDFSSFAKGIYFVNITDDQNNKTVKKIVIE